MNFKLHLSDAIYLAFNMPMLCSIVTRVCVCALLNLSSGQQVVLGNGVSMYGASVYALSPSRQPISPKNYVLLAERISNEMPTLYT